MATKAKKQARALGDRLGIPVDMAVASVAFFEYDRWTAKLEDPIPEEVVLSNPSLTPEVALTAYYRPLATAIRQSRPQRVVTDLWTAAEGYLPEMDMAIRMPERIFRKFDDVPETGPLLIDTAAVIGEGIRSTLIEAAWAKPSSTMELLMARNRAEAEQPDTVMPADGIEVLLAESGSEPGGEGLQVRF